MKRIAASMMAALLAFSMIACQGQMDAPLETGTPSAQTTQPQEPEETPESGGEEPESAEPQGQSGSILIAYFTLGRNAAEVSPIGMVTSDLSVFEDLSASVDVTFDFAA